MPTCLCGFPGIHTCSRQAKQMPSSFHSPFQYAQLPHIGIAVIFLPQLGQKSVISLAYVPCPRRYLANGIHIPQWVHCGVSASYTLHSAIVKSSVHLGAAVGAVRRLPIGPYIGIKPLKSVPSANRAWLVAFPPPMSHWRNIDNNAFWYFLYRSFEIILKDYSTKSAPIG